jgi:hypothetical protein
MYKVIYWNNVSHKRIVEYGFSKWMMKRVSFLWNRDDFEIAFICPLVKSFDTFKKCFTNYLEVLE